MSALVAVILAVAAGVLSGANAVLTGDAGVLTGAAGILAGAIAVFDGPAAVLSRALIGTADFKSLPFWHSSFFLSLFFCYYLYVTIFQLFSFSHCFFSSDCMQIKFSKCLIVNLQGAYLCILMFHS